MITTWRRPLVAGVIATLLYNVLLQFSPLVGGQTLNIALWDGTFLTLNLGLATLVGYVMEFIIGTILAVLYIRFIPQQTSHSILKTGMVFGLALWAVAMIVGLPLFDSISPLVQNGLMLSPGLFAFHLGLSATLAFLVASLGYALSISYIIERTTL